MLYGVIMSEMETVRWSVETYIDERGKDPIWEFIRGLQRKEQAKVLRAFDLLEKYGTRLRMPDARHIEDALWELRADASRLFYFLHVGRRFIILHGYRKKTDKAPLREIATAERRMRDFLEREAHGS